MRSITLYIAASLDGYIARPNGDIDWLTAFDNPAEDYGYGAFLDTVDTVLMGRLTYEQVLTFGDYPYPNQTGYVFSRTQNGRDAHVTFVNEDVPSFVRQLQSQPGGVIWLVGGTGLNVEFMRHNLIDEYIISIIPVVLGEGIPLFPTPLPTQPLRLLACQSYESGIVQVRYGR